MASHERNDESLRTTKRDELVREHLCGLGVTIEDAPEELIKEAEAYADSILGAGKDN